MTNITITCPITWYTRCQWLQDRSISYVDNTCWAAWTIGYDDIYILVDAEVATLYYLVWGK